MYLAFVCIQMNGTLRFFYNKTHFIIKSLSLIKSNYFTNFNDFNEPVLVYHVYLFVKHAYPNIIQNNHQININ